MIKASVQARKIFLSADQGEAWVGDYGVRVSCASRDVIAVELLRGGPQDSPVGVKPSPLLVKAVDQLAEYLQGQRKEFNLPLWVSGSPFYSRVWDALRKVPHGKTVTYGELAEASGNPKAVRAVGGAMGANEIPLLIPCHRVVASGGKLGGFAYGAEWKKWLLDLEHSDLVFE